MTDKFIPVPEDQYKELLSAQRVLDALYANGVDNWEGFGGALESIDWEEE